jgi:hypothetical protein
MNVSQAGGLAASEAFTALMNSGSFVFRTGTIPATPETTATGTLLATWTFTSSAFTTVFTSPNVVATANFAARFGQPSRFRHGRLCAWV